MATEKELREKLVNVAVSYLGVKKGSKKHKEIIDTFNTVKPYGYTGKYTDAWCAEFVTACVVKAFGKTIAKKYFPLSAGCPSMITQAKKLGIWVENDAYKPNAGDYILYDWDDNGKGNNTGCPDHIGIVEKVKNGKITIIEGNYSNAVKRREISINAKYIRGFATPKYSAMTTGKEESKKEESKKEESKKSIDEIAKEVIAGKWGNGEDRKNKLTKAGYDYNAVQKRVNELISKPANTTTKYKVVATAGMNVRKSPTTNAHIVGTLKYGQVFTSSKKSGDWVYCDNRKGWVCIKQGKNTYLKKV